MPFPTPQKLATLPLVALIQAYRWFVSPMLGANCRFAPSCSEYALEAVRRHGALRGTGLAASRLCRCHPFGGSGFDPVPPARSPSPVPPDAADARRRGTLHCDPVR